jgi:hypothetical protein
MKAPAIDFPKTPEHPYSINDELRERLDLLRFLDRMRREAARPASDATSARARADQWIYEWLIKGARESIAERGPLTDHAQKAELADFVRSLEKPTPEAA